MSSSQISLPGDLSRAPGQPTIMDTSSSPLSSWRTVSVCVSVCVCVCVSVLVSVELPLSNSLYKGSGLRVRECCVLLVLLKFVCMFTLYW